MFFTTAAGAHRTTLASSPSPGGGPAGLAAGAGAGALGAPLPDAAGEAGGAGCGGAVGAGEAGGGVGADVAGFTATGASPIGSGGLVATQKQRRPRAGAAGVCGA